MPCLSSCSTMGATAAAASSLLTVTRTSSEPGARQRRNLLDGRGNVSGIRVRHGLHHNRCIAAHANPIDRASDSFSALNISHAEALF